MLNRVVVMGCLTRDPDIRVTGSMVVVYGRLQVRRWKDKDGVARRLTEVVADSVYFADSRKSEQPGQQQELQQAVFCDVGDVDDGFPF